MTKHRNRTSDFFAPKIRTSDIGGYTQIGPTLCVTHTIESIQSFTAQLLQLLSVFVFDADRRRRRVPRTVLKKSWTLMSDCK